MKIVSLVPSWTETLIRAELNVVGRTRFCIHPIDEVETIVTVGGTKTPDIDKIKSLKPDLIVLDKEENTREASEQLSGFPLYVSHVTSILDLPKELNGLADTVGGPRGAQLKQFSQRWRELTSIQLPSTGIDEIPGVVKWVKKPELPPKRLIYLIWHNPWMSVSQQTFIGSILKWLNLEIEVYNHSQPYPEISLEDLDQSETLLLASSEPFPFEKKPELLSSLEASSAIVDGEVYSWFGSRSLLALEEWLIDRS